ncbi:MAG TPA: alpha-glucan family phosphorylase [Casimicrobiaceae bacterium]|nr:alpha-glucan family phosphorylase [Casimicrobiaceae bacterium]
MHAPGTPYVIEVNPVIPPRLARLQELAGNLWYSWDRPTRDLFQRLHPALWEAVGHNPKAFLKRVDQRRLDAAAEDPTFVSNFNSILSAFDTYNDASTGRNGGPAREQHDLVAYFCAEFGFHESLQIYSGGLGILAGDHCKAASDLRLPLVAVGLLYRQGYFAQTIDADGSQHVAYADSDFADLPIEPVVDEKGAEIRIAVELPNRHVAVRVWRVRAGHVVLYLLDTDVAENTERDRIITYRLYGGDRLTRIEQEIVLGIGGVRTLAAVGVQPSVWHMNEGHAAFLVLERCRLAVAAGHDFASALEAVAAASVFTTHTAVAAGHDHFDADTIRQYFDGYCRSVGIDVETLLALGRTPGSNDFNMTALAVRGSRYHNGVSRIHGGVSSQMLSELWPEVPAEENPIEHVTNGVHVRTFLAVEWFDIFDRFLGHDWQRRLQHSTSWEDIDRLPDHIFWPVHQYLKMRMLELVRRRVRRQHFRNEGSETHLDRLFRFANPEDPNVLTVGFGRRFATYKRAALLFYDLDWLREIVSDPKRPVLFIFAGRAHPADVPGQDVMREIARVAAMPEFEGRVLLVEGYDLQLARELVSGVDVWLNNPIYPLEASGTSGMKAGMNGVVNLSVLDGWWGEGYRTGNGWAIKPASAAADATRRDMEESRTLYEILQDHVLPLYYDRGTQGYSQEWIAMAKASMASILPRFNATRMVNEYVSKFYHPAARQGRRLAEHGYAGASALAAWQTRVRAAWPGVKLRRIDAPSSRITFGDRVTIEVAVAMKGLAADDLRVELCVSRPEREANSDEQHRYALTAQGAPGDNGEQRYAIDFAPDLCGRLDYRIRAYPTHPDLAHAFQLGLMRWA